MVEGHVVVGSNPTFGMWSRVLTGKGAGLRPQLSGFDSQRDYANIAQLVEHLASTQDTSARFRLFALVHLIPMAGAPVATRCVSVRIWTGALWRGGGVVNRIGFEHRRS